MAERVLLASGREAEVFLEGDDAVLKLIREPSYAPRVDREAAALRVLEANGHAAPRVVQRVTVEGRPGLVMTRIEGQDLLGRLAAQPWTLVRAARSMARTHVAMHDCAAPDDLPELNAELLDRIERVDVLPDDLRGPVLDVLASLPQGDRLCHGDLHVGNMVGSWDAPQAIDWGDASRGDPVADVARTELLHWLGRPPASTPRHIRLLAPVGGKLLARAYLAAYRKERPVDGDLLQRWRLVRAAARLLEAIPGEREPLLRSIRRNVRG